MRNNQRNRPLHSRFLPMPFLESPSSPVAITLEPTNSIPATGQGKVLNKLIRNLIRT